MDEYGIGSSTIYDIKAQSKKLRDFVKDTDNGDKDKAVTFTLSDEDLIDAVLEESYEK